MIEVHESGMKFSLKEEDTFYIENSEIYRKVKDKGVASVEFITLAKNRVLVTEAKSSIPKSQEQEKENFWERINNKNIHTMLLFSKAILTGKTEEIGQNLIHAVHENTHTVFLLVLSGFTGSVCNDLSEVYREKIKSIAKIYNAEVLVINDVQARKFGLIA